MVGILCGIMPIISLCLTGLFFIPKGILNISSFIAIFYLCQKILPYQLHYIDLFINTKKVEEEVNQNIVTQPTTVRLAQAGNYSGMIGAALLALKGGAD